ncbi:scaffolding protein [Gordonia phage MScarn]|uniref:Scaffolding protein n=2 Tax=Emalynvirus troje TaxID=2560511 RepID=A0A2K9VEK2_9CAUD|nr:head scaffolding protein [Gordonia phage Troje]AUV60713.1 scaffolding protein [Gordonia phage Troje]QWY84880.1 scaffolding protein [Gordonia phage MScarn]
MADDNKDLDKPLGEAGYRALVDERAANKDLKAELASLKQELDVAKGETETWKQRASDHEAKLKERDEADAVTKLREDVAKAKSTDDRQVPAHLLQGKTKEELEASADQLLEYLGETTGPRSPQPDPNQGQSHNSGAGASDDAAALAILGFSEE